MRIYSHYFWSYVIFRKKRWGHEVAAFSIFPDMPYFMAYLATWGKMADRGREGFRQGALYFVENSTHSLTFLGIASLIFILLKRKTFYPLLIGWLLHLTGDYLTHVTDAYPVFWPLSNRRFPAFISYWDPAYHGREFTMINHLLMLTILTIIVTSWLRNAHRLRKLKRGAGSR